MERKGDRNFGAELMATGDEALRRIRGGQNIPDITKACGDITAEDAVRVILMGHLNGLKAKILAQLKGENVPHATDLIIRNERKRERNYPVPGRLAEVEFDDTDILNAVRNLKSAPEQENITRFVRQAIVEICGGTQLTPKKEDVGNITAPVFSFEFDNTDPSGHRLILARLELINPGDKPTADRKYAHELGGGDYLEAIKGLGADNPSRGQRKKGIFTWMTDPCYVSRVTPYFVDPRKKMNLVKFPEAAGSPSLKQILWPPEGSFGRGAH